MVESFFMDLKFPALYHAWPFHTTKLVTDRVSIPLVEVNILPLCVPGGGHHLCT